jgi:hypothetical protein
VDYGRPGVYVSITYETRRILTINGSADIAVYDAMVEVARFWHPRRRCWASAQTIAELTGVSRTTVFRSWWHLQRAGKIRQTGWMRVGDVRRTRIYVFVCDDARLRARALAHGTQGLRQFEKLTRRAKALLVEKPQRAAFPPRRRRLSMTEGQQLVAWFVDECIEQSKPHMLGQKGQMARRAKELLDTAADGSGATLESVQEAITEYVRRDAKTPLALAEIWGDLERERTYEPDKRPSARKRAQEWIAENGWPTGIKKVRGSHSMTQIYDALGTEPFSEETDWPYGKPTFDEIVTALLNAKG